MAKLNATQKTGLAIGLAGILLPLLIVGYQVSGDKVATGAVGSGPEIINWILKMFGGGGVVSIGGIITFLWSFFKNRISPTVLPLTPGGVINTNGATPDELGELAMATMAFLANRTSKVAQYRFVAAVSAVSDVIPNFSSEIVDGVLISKLKLFDGVPVAATSGKGAA